VEKKEFETIRDLLILLNLKSGVSYESLAEVTELNTKYLQNKFPMSRVSRKKENA
jgi:hypothetical protein